MIDQLWFSFFSMNRWLATEPGETGCVGPEIRVKRRGLRSRRATLRVTHMQAIIVPHDPPSPPPHVWSPSMMLTSTATRGSILYDLYIILIKYYFYLIIFLLINNSFDDLFNLSNFLVIKNIYLPIVLKIGTGLLV